MKLNRIAEAIALAVSLSMFGCVTATPTSAQDQRRAQTFPLPDVGAVARVYVARPSGFDGRFMLSQVMVDGRIACVIGPKNYIVLDLPVGEHVFAVAPAVKQALRVNLDAGKLHFLQVNYTAGTVTVITPEEGERLVATGTRVQATI